MQRKKIKSTLLKSIEKTAINIIADVPQFVIDIFEISGICIRELEERLMMDDIVYGE
jgi:hypothetical protein